MVAIEEIDQRTVLPFDQPNLQFPHETAHRQPEIVPHHDDALHPPAVTLPQGLHQFRVLLLPFSHGATARTGRGRSAPSCPPEYPALGAMRPASPSAPSYADKAGHRFRRPFSSRPPFPRRWLRRKRRSRRRTDAATAPPSPATTCRNPKARRSGPPKRVVSVRLLDPGFPEANAVGQSSRSRGPGSSSRKKSASWASKDRKPFGTILMGWLSEFGVSSGVTECGAMQKLDKEYRLLSYSKRRAIFSTSVDCSARSAAGRRPCPWPSSTAPRLALRGPSDRCVPVPSGWCRPTAGEGELPCS